MPPIVVPWHFLSFKENLKDVDRLLDFHVKIAGGTRGRKYEVEVLNKGALVLLVACWEAFVEEVAGSAFEFLLNNATNHSVFPAKVLSLASEPLRKAQDGREVWQLAGDGWKKVLIDHRDRTLSKSINGFNTPRAENIDRLYEHLLGITGISRNWRWRGITPEQATKKLNDIISTRGSIAHKVKHSGYVYKKDVEDARKFILRLAVITNNRTCNHLKKLTKKKPWKTYKYRTVK